MKTISNFFIILKKTIKTGKVRCLSIITLTAILYILIFVTLLSSFSMKKTGNATYKENLSGEDIEISYSCGLNNVSYSSYTKLKNVILDFDDDLKAIYASNNQFDLYDFDYISLSSIDESLKDILLEDNGVFLNEEYKDSYSIGDYYSIDDTSFKVLGFFEGDAMVIANLDYVLSLNSFSIRSVSFIYNFSDLKNSDINKLLSIYDEMNDYSSNQEYLYSSSLDLISDINKVSGIYLIGSIILIIIFTIFSVVAILNVYEINSKIDLEFYSILRLNGMTKSRINHFGMLENMIINIASFIISLLIFYAIFKPLKTFLLKLITIIFELSIDELYFDIKMVYDKNPLIFIIPLLLNLFFIALRLIIKGHITDDFITLEGLDDYAR